MIVLEALLFSLTIITAVALGITIVIYGIKYPFEKSIPGRIIMAGMIGLEMMISVGLIRRSGNHQLADMVATGSYVFLAGVIIMALRMLLSYRPRKAEEAKAAKAKAKKELDQPKGQTFFGPPVMQEPRHTQPPR